MKLSYMKLKNFGPYYGEQIINFAINADQHVTVIHAKNGSGKTTLFTALNWCLYGKEFLKKNIDHLVSRPSLIEGKNVDTSVEIGFTYQDIEYSAERRFQGISPDGETIRSRKEIFFLKSADGPPSPDPYASEWINSKIPQDVTTHFFFDGEKIGKFAQEENETEVENAVRSVLRIEDYERGMKHLQNVVRDYRQAFNQHASGESKVLLDKRIKYQTELDKIDKELSDNHEEIESAKKQKKRIDIKLEKIESSRKLAEERREIEKILEYHKEEKSALLEEIRRLANQSFIPIASPVLSKALEILGKDESRIVVPDTLLNKLLDQLCRLCGKPIVDQSPDHDNIRKLLEQTVSPEFDYEVRNTYNALAQLQTNEAKNTPQQLKSALIKDKKLKQKIQTKEMRLEKIREDLLDFDQDSVDDFQKRRDKYTQNIGTMNQKIENLKIDHKKNQKELDDLDNQIREADVSSEKAKQLKLRLDLAQDSAQAMKQIYELFAEDMREAIEAEVPKVFRRLVWKENFFQDVRLSPTYALEVIDNLGRNIRLGMSAGEHEVLSLAFLMAMANVAVDTMLPNTKSETFPIVMDTPFARLDTEHRENITLTLPQVADQLIVFVISDEELHGQARENLEPKIGEEYCLKFAGEEEGTTIETISKKGNDVTS